MVRSFAGVVHAAFDAIVLAHTEKRRTSAPPKCDLSRSWRASCRRSTGSGRRTAGRPAAPTTQASSGDRPDQRASACVGRQSPRASLFWPRFREGRAATWSSSSFQRLSSKRRSRAGDAQLRALSHVAQNKWNAMTSSVGGVGLAGRLASSAVRGGRIDGGGQDVRARKRRDTCGQGRSRA